MGGEFAPASLGGRSWWNPLVGGPALLGDVSSRDRSDEPDPTARGQPAEGRVRWKRSADVVVAAGLMLVAALAAAVLPDGSMLRLAVALPILGIAPGYLLLQALIVPARSWTARGRHALLALGLSPAVLGLLALSTAIVPGGFRPVPIAATVTVGCLAFAGVALRRRWSQARAIAGEEEDVTQTA